MQKKNDETFGFKLLVIMTFKLTKEPIKYAPLSPKKILANGKLNKRKISNIIIWEVNKKENCKFPLLKFKYSKITFIIIKLIDNNPLKPSIKFAPFITNRKQSRTKIAEKISILRASVKKGISILKILIGKK